MNTTTFDRMICKTCKTSSRLSDGFRIDWFQVVETRGHVADGNVAHFQVTLKVGFRIE